MKKAVFIGIDISKDSFDVVIFLPGSSEKPTHQKFANNSKGFNQLLKWITLQHALQDCLFCLEDTGNYSYGLSCFLVSHQAFVCVESAYRIKHSMGIQRGKSDPSDAEMIARYAYRFADDLSPFVMPSAAVAQLKALISFRIRLIKQKTRLAVAITEIKQLKGLVDISFMISSLNKQLKDIKEQIRLCDKKIERAIHQDQQLHHQACFCFLFLVLDRSSLLMCWLILKVLPSLIAGGNLRAMQEQLPSPINQEPVFVGRQGYLLLLTGDLRDY